MFKVNSTRWDEFARIKWQSLWVWQGEMMQPITMGGWGDISTCIWDLPKFRRTLKGMFKQKQLALFSIIVWQWWKILKGKNPSKSCCPVYIFDPQFSSKMMFLTCHQEQESERFSHSRTEDPSLDVFSPKEEVWEENKCFPASAEMHSSPCRAGHCPPRIK